MAELRYARGHLIGMAVLGTLALPFLFIIPLSEGLAAGEFVGPVSTPLYLIGPAGRWMVALALAGALAVKIVRCLRIGAGDRVALSATPAGLVCRTLAARRTASWDQVTGIHHVTSRWGTHRWRKVRIRTVDGIVERTWTVPAELLDATDLAVHRWIEEARAIQVAARNGRLPARPPTPGGFGRRPIVLRS